MTSKIIKQHRNFHFCGCCSKQLTVRGSLCESVAKTINKPARSALISLLVILFGIAGTLTGCQTTGTSPSVTAPSENEVQPTSEEIKSFLTSGIVLQTYTKGKTRKKKFHASGLLDNLGNGNQGLWSVDETGRLCQEWERKKCTAVQRSGDSLSVYKNGEKYYTFKIIQK
jgi:hypothetical protein